MVVLGISRRVVISGYRKRIRELGLVLGDRGRV